MSSAIPPPAPPPMMSEFSGKIKENYSHSFIYSIKALAFPQLPQYLCKKHKYSVTEPVKKIQWIKVSVYFFIFVFLFNNSDKSIYNKERVFIGSMLMKKNMSMMHFFLIYEKTLLVK